MKTTKKLKTIYEMAKGENRYYSLEDLKKDAKSFIKDIKTSKTVCRMDVSKSGMSRRFNYLKYNMLLNICYNNKFSWDSIKVGGCGMDMHWHLQFRACQELLTEKELEKNTINSKCSHGSIL
jgi:hypothetical protein